MLSRSQIYASQVLKVRQSAAEFMAKVPVSHLATEAVTQCKLDLKPSYLAKQAADS